MAHTHNYFVEHDGFFGRPFFKGDYFTKNPFFKKPFFSTEFGAKSIALNDGDVTHNGDTWVFTSATPLTLPIIVTIHVKEGGDPGFATLGGDIHIHFPVVVYFGGGRTGGGLEDFYFKGEVSADRLTFTLTSVQSAQTANADANMQISFHDE